MKILFLLSRVPLRLEKGDKLRAFYQLKELSKRHELILFALSEDPDQIPEATAELKKYCSEVYLFPVSKLKALGNLAKAFSNNKPAQVNYFYHPVAQQQIDQIIRKHQPDHIFCQLVRMSEYVRHIKTIPKTLDYMDAFSKGMARRAEIAPFYLKPAFTFESERLKAYETEVFDDFEHTTIISGQDRNLIDHPRNQEIAIVPNGIDTDFFHPLERIKNFELVFAGNMSYAPNVDTAVFLVKKVLPLVLEKLPETRLLLAGATPSQRVLTLQSENVYVSGWMDDIREAYASARVFVAPMSIGTGVQNKVLEAMAMKIPCIISPLVNNGVGAAENEHLLLAATPEEVAEQIIKLLSDQYLAENLAQKAYDFVRKNYDWKSAVAQLETVMLSE
ncbi:glycosyltransferase [Adhaeribacter soli]|uniref:Glycosyltransferase n=1 Tax=Adhaeribacter soli TaxID=2607655 RepID=A0A5N1ILD4_9BACT|nr:glycosyltransferase [Adhaeribacter soli]KAA9326016.1 glycosyltransferase [Adhaeribacter soli]